MPSIRSSSHARTESQRGFVLVIALVLAILYFMLMTLVMIDSSRAQAEAQRYRARVVAATLAENAAELACVQMVNQPTGMAMLQDSQGKMMGGYHHTSGDNFEINGEGETKGVLTQKATVMIEGHFEGNRIRIDWTRHSQ